MLLNKTTLTASLKVFFFILWGPGVEHGSAASTVKSCMQLPVLQKFLCVGVFFFHFRSLKPHSILRCWFTFALYTRKLSTVSFLCNLFWVLLGFFAFFLSEHQLRVCAEQSQ